MSVRQLFAIGMVFLAVSAGWWVLGATVQERTDDLDRSLSAEMESLWGPKVLAQGSPYFARTGAARDEGEIVRPSASALTAKISHQHRYKGLLWYSTFDVDFTGRYDFPPAEADADEGEGHFMFPLPDGASTYHDLSVTVDGQPVEVERGNIESGRIAVRLNRREARRVEVRYVTGGQDAWLYSPGEAASVDDSRDTPAVLAGERLNELRDFSLTVTTDFAEIDYPRGALSPTQRAEPTESGGGMRATWDYSNLITRRSIGVVMPKRLNAGPIAARMSFFAPVSLLFFFTVLLAVVVLKNVRLHPMHYLFIAAGFFAFHILMAYLADIVNIHWAFWASAAVSVLLVATYMRLVAGVKFALVYTGLAQLVYLVGFSYAFFWVGRTGLTVTVCAVATLFVLMQATGRVNWQDVFTRPEPPTVIPPLPPASLPDRAP